MMTDLDKVLKGLECCGDINKTQCHLCPYDYNGRSDRHECTADMASDALDLLKSKQAEIERLKGMNRELVSLNGMDV